jgi:single stranded DNA-binding protein
MSEDLNRVMLLGNLGADPELRYTTGGQPVLNLRLATKESYLDKDKVRHERTDWHNVVVWGKRGEALAKLLAKGSSVFIEGPLRTSSYDDREGHKRYKTEIVANNVLLTGRGRGEPVPSDGAGEAHAPTPHVQDETAGRPANTHAPLASDQDLDGAYGNPIVKFVPSRWGGEDFRGRRYSECTPEFLDVLASTLQWSADNPQEGKARFVEFNRKDAARARGWAARLRRNGTDAQPQAAASSHRDAGDLEGGDAGSDDDIPF